MPLLFCRTAVICSFFLFSLTTEPVLAGSACDSTPCLNGGICSELDSTWVCSCPNGFLGPSCALNAADNEGIVAELASEGNGTSNLIGLSSNPPGKSGMGQIFTPSRNGVLQHVSFEIRIRQEGIDEDEGLIVEFWNVDSSGLPVGNSLATQVVPASSFSSAANSEIQSVDFSAANISLSNMKSYAFTLSVARNGVTIPSSMYGFSFYENALAYPEGTVIASTGGGPWSLRDYDLLRFEVTALVSLYDNGFESPPPLCDPFFENAFFFTQGGSLESLFMRGGTRIWANFENTIPNHEISAINKDANVDIKMEIWYPDEAFDGCAPADYTYDEVGAGMNLTEKHDTGLEGIAPIPNGLVRIRITNLGGSGLFTLHDAD